MRFDFVRGLRFRIAQRREWFLHYQVGKVSFQSIKDELMSLPLHPSNDEGEEEQVWLVTEWERALRSFQQGDPRYEDKLLAVMRGSQQLAEQDASFAALRKYEQAYEASLETQRKVIKGAVGGGAGALCLLAGVSGNRRRRQVKEQAEELLGKRRAGPAWAFRLPWGRHAVRSVPVLRVVRVVRVSAHRCRGLGEVLSARVRAWVVWVGSSDGKVIPTSPFLFPIRV